MATVKDIYQAEKTIGFFPGWSPPESETDYVWFEAPLEIGGVTETGLVLHGGCFVNRPNLHVSFELRISKQAGRRCIPIERLDWRALDGGHSNPRRPRSVWASRRVSETHLHDFALNWVEAEQRMRLGGLRTAREIDSPLQSFSDVRSYIGKRFNINNIEVVTEPPWVYDLFSGMA